MPFEFKKIDYSPADSLVISGIAFTQLPVILQSPKSLYGFLIRTHLDVTNPVPVLSFDRNEARPEVIWPPVVLDFETICHLAAQIEATMALAGRLPEYYGEVAKNMMRLGDDRHTATGLTNWNCEHCGVPGVMDHATGVVTTVGGIGHSATCPRRGDAPEQGERSE